MANFTAIVLTDPIISYGAPYCIDCKRELQVGQILYVDTWDGGCYCGNCLANGDGMVGLNDPQSEEQTLFILEGGQE